MKNSSIFWGRLLLALGLISALVLPVQGVVYAAANLTITPITWNVIGLDSNNVNAGPNNFPVGARVCNTGDQPATNVSSSFVWDDNNPYINFRPGSKESYSGYTLAPGECQDFYYEVQVTRTAAAHNTTRRYHITATATGLGTVSTPTSREIYVERLVSQSRNAVWNITLDGSPVAAGGTMTLMVGGTYNIQLEGHTATNGYEQIESFINFPNTIFQTNSVTTTYSASAGTDGEAAIKLYANGCGWVNDPTSPNYRSCTGTGKYGGTVTITYNVTIIGGGGTSQLLNTLVYDFSGSSYHYNGDFSAAARIANIVDPASSVMFAKSFSPASVTAGGTTTLTFTITNPSTVPLSGVSFTDALPSTPGIMRVAATPNPSTTGCGTPVFAPVANDTTLSFSNGTLAASGTCTIHVDVTVPAAPTSGTYVNNSNPLSVGGVNTGKTASANLTLASTGSSICGPVTLAQWTFTGANGAASAPAPSIQAGNVATAQTSTTAGSPVIDTNRWRAEDFPAAGPITDTSTYMLFTVDTSHYSNVNIALSYTRSSDWKANSSTFRVYSSTTGAAGSYSQIFSVTGATFDTTLRSTGAQNAALTGTGLTYFRINAFGTNNANANLTLDNVTVSGTSCTPVQPPNLSKSFSPDPIAVGGTSTLTFTVTNSNATTALTGVQFTDTLPAGLTVATGSVAACGGTLTRTAPNQISLSGATIASGATCTIPVTVTATTSGLHANVSGFVSSIEGGTNSTGSGQGTDTLTALLPPVISKLFGPNPVLTGGTSTLTFTITNPNPNNALTGVAFTDTFPTGMTRSAAPAAAQCGGIVTSTAGSITLAGGAIPAGGTCSVSVVVTATASSSTDYVNISGNVSAALVGSGNTASDTLTVNPVRPALSLLKLVSTSASGPWSPFITVTPGTNVFYQFVVENTGDVPLSPITLTDPTVNTASCAWPATLPVAGPTTDPTAICVVGPVAVAAGDHPNTASAHGGFGGNTFNSNPSTADVLAVTPGFSLLKQVSTSASGPWASLLSGLAPGTPVYYRFNVVNMGATALTGISITDANVSTSACTFTDPLPVGGATTCIVGPITGSAIAGTFTNMAIAHASSLGTPVHSARSFASYIVSTTAPDLSLTKTNNTGGNGFVTAPFTWTVQVSNAAGAGDAGFASGQTILSDPLPDGATYGAVTVGGFTNITNSANITCAIAAGTLSCTASGGSVTIGAGGSFTASFSATPTSAGTLSNTATVDPLGVVAESDEANNTGGDVVNLTIGTPGMTVAKTPNVASVNMPGNIITYTVLVTNTGNVPLTDVSVSDPLVGGLDCDLGTPGPQRTGLTVAPGASLTCIGSYTVSLADFSNNGGGDGNIDNTVTVTSAQLPPQTASIAVPLVALETITLLKTGTLHMDVVAPAGRADPGDTITYAFTVTNPSPLPLANITLADTVGGVSISGGPISILLPGATDGTTFTGIYSLTQADIQAGTFTNTATVSGDGIFSRATASDEESVDIPQSPSFTVTKSSDPTSVNAAPSLITYTIMVVNTGNVNLTGVSVSDPLLADLDCDAAAGTQTTGLTVAPGASLTCTGTYTVTQADLDNNGGGDGDIDNMVTVDTDQTGAQTASALVTLPQSPALSVAKSITSGSPYDSVGDVIQYSYLVTNTGNVTLPGPVSVSDDLSIDETCPTVVSLAPGASVTCVATYTVTQADLDNGEVVNTATASAGTTTSTPDTATATATQSPAIRITKTMPTVTFDSPQLIHITYSMLVENIGNVALNAIQVEDDLSLTFATASSVTIEQLASAAFAVNAAFNGITDIALLDGTDSLAPGASGTITLRILVDTGGNPASYTNLATASGWTRTETQVQDQDQVSGPSFMDPAVTKTVDPAQAAVGETVTYTITVTNNGSLPALNVIVTDILPNFLDLALNPVTLNPNVGTVTITPPRTVTIDLGTVAAGGTHVITIRAIVNAAGNPVVNTVQLTTTAQDGWPGNLLVNDRALSSLVTTAAPPPPGGGGGAGLTDKTLPKTGFAPGIVSRLAPQPSDKAYAALGDVWIEIPSLNVKTPIVGVPSADKGWNTTWLTNETGWLEGSAFPGWAGNSALTGHVYLANGKPGPFVNLSKLKWGDQVIVHAYGEKYTFEVRENKRVSPSDGSVLKHEEFSWLTLLTCNSFNPVTEEYALRVSVRAVLVKAEAE